MPKIIKTLEKALMKKRLLKPLPDEVLIGRIVSGEKELFELIMRRYNQLLFRVARAITGCDHEAEDVVQNGYILAFQRLAQLKDRTKLKAWLCQIIRNEALTSHRHSNQYSADGRNELDAIHEANIADDDMQLHDGPDAEIEQVRVRQNLEYAIDRLPYEYREAFILYFVQQMTLADTAEVLELPLPTLKTRIHRARKLVKFDLIGEHQGSVSEIFAFDGERCDRIVYSVIQHLARNEKQCSTIC